MFVSLVTIPTMECAQPVNREPTKIQQAQMHVHLAQPLVQRRQELGQLTRQNVVGTSTILFF